jgi:glucose/mannose-6-phosphate isomerase
MTNLDDMQVYRKLDPEGMLEQLHGFSRQCRTAWREANDFKLPKSYARLDKVVILGMGGSAVGGDLVRGLAISIAKPVIIVSHEYDLPHFVDERTLVIASSYSGNTEEILSAFSQALKKDCKKLAITIGGKLKLLAEEAKIPVFTIGHHSSPRAALGYSFMPLLAMLQNLGLIQDQSASVEAMIQGLEAQVEELHETVPTTSNPAKQLAQTLYGKIAVIYGAGVLSEAARRWKTQINENSKAWAFYEVFPELNHNAVVGYGAPAELASKIYVVMLPCPSLHHRILIRYDITSELMKQNAISHQIIDAGGKDALSQMMRMVFYGDWVSYYLSMLYQTDPTPVKSIDYLKNRLQKG